MTYYFAMLWLCVAMSYISIIVVVDYKDMLVIVITASSIGVFVLCLILFYGDKT